MRKYRPLRVDETLMGGDEFSGFGKNSWIVFTANSRWIGRRYTSEFVKCRRPLKSKEAVATVKQHAKVKIKPWRCNDPLCIKEDVCDMAVCDGVSICSHAVLKTAVLAQQMHNNERDAIAAWLNHCKWHLKMNGAGCDISSDGKCKHWFIMGYKAATAPVS